MKKSFTVVELLITVIIIGILAGFAVPGFLSAMNKAKIKHCYKNVDQLHKAVERFGYERGSMPTVADFVPAQMTFYGASADVFKCPAYKGTGHEYTLSAGVTGISWSQYLALANTQAIVVGKQNVHEDQGVKFNFYSTKNGIKKN